ncbi:MAG: SusC/RagA family TonB-linked outer membrane protein [Bacteroidota bacterium]
MSRSLLIVFFLLVASAVYAQDQTATGVVTTPSEPNGLPGVNVIIKGTTRGSITDLDGRFRLDAPVGSTLIFSFIGYKPKEVIFTGQTNLEVALEEELKELNEIVVTGYSSVQKRDITGAITSIKTDKFREIALTGIDQALQGQAPGVQVVQSSGTPGGGISVRIRGNTSINASNRPLFIVDGIQVETGTLSLRSFGGQDDNALSLINPGDIESIQVLKDASAKAQYGSRAANGVVVITTKRGRKSAATINFDVQRGIIDPVKKQELLNATDLLTLQREAVTNAGRNPDALGLIPGVTDGVSTDWLDEIFRRGILQQYQLTIRGGDDNSSYYISSNYRDEEGVQLNNRFERFSGTINLDEKVSKKLTLGTNMTLSRSLNQRVKGDNFLDGVYSGALKALPYNVPYNENGELVGPGSPLYAGFPNFNPVAQAVLPRFDAITVKLLGGINGVYQFNEKMMLKSQVSLDYNNVTEDQYESSQTAIGGFLDGVGGQGYGVYITGASTNFVANTTFSYNNLFDGVHQVSGLLGTEVFRNYYRTSNVIGRLFPSDDFTYITSAGIVDQGSSSRLNSGLFSVFGEVKYDYKDKYLASIGMRTDGSSRFGPGNRFGYFPSLSAAWRLSEEAFFQSDIINDLKLRLSAGLTGNERIPDYQFLGVWGSTIYNGSPGLAPSQLGNPNLKWETTRELNTGVDISLLDGRIQATADAYYNKTYDLLLLRPYASTTGFSSVWENVGELENKGIELGLVTVNIDKAVKWTTDINLSRNVNKVLFLADSIPQYRGYQVEGASATNIIKEGQPLGTFIGLNFLGVDPATGNAIYADTNEDGQINNSDEVILGNAQPKLIGGMTNRVAYKGFDFTAFFQFSYGNKVLNLTKASLVNSGLDITSNQSPEALRRWQKEGDITDVPRYELENTFNNYHSSRLLEDGSFLRLKNVGFGYNIPNKYSDRFFLDRVRVYVSATNLWTYTKYSGADPEVSTLSGSTAAQGIDFFTLPQVRTISIGLNANLK